MQTLSIAQLEQHIRWGTEPDSPALIDCYFNHIHNIRAATLGSAQQVQLYLQTARLLLDTICDCCVAEHWRRQCLNVIYRPLFAAKRHAIMSSDLQQIRHFQNEMRILTHYFL